MAKALGIIGTLVGTVAGAIVGGPAGAAIGGSLGSIAGGLLGKAFGKSGAAALPRPDDVQTTYAQGLVPRVRGYGRARLAGATLFLDSTEGTAFHLQALHHGPIDAVEQHWLGDEAVTLDGSKHVSDPAHYQGKVLLDSWLGETPGTAEAALVANFPSLWTEDHRNDGIAKLLLICEGAAPEDFRDVYPNGALPQATALCRLSPVWDPRDEGQDPDDPETWTWSDNAALAVLDYLTHADGFRRNRTKEILPAIEEWIAAAEVCDEAVTLKAGGSEPRYRANGVYSLDNRPADVLAGLLSVMDGWLYRRPDGAIGIKAGRYEAPTVTIGAEHIVGYEVAFGRPREELVNEIRASYVSPDHDWRTQEAQPWRDAAAISADGEVLSRSLELASLVASHGQTRRLMKRTYSRERTELRGTATTDAYGLAARGQRYVTLDLAEVGYPDLIVEVTAYRVNLEAISATIEWIAADTAIDAWDAATEEGDAPAVPTRSDKDAAALPVPSGLAVMAEEVLVGVAQSGVRLRVTWDLPGRTDLVYDVRHRKGTDAWVVERTPGNVSGLTVTHVTPLVEEGETYSVEVRSVTAGGRAGAWCTAETADSTLSIAAPAAPTLFSATGSPTVTVEWRNANSASVHAARVWRADTSPDFEDAVQIAGPIYSAPNNVLTFDDTPGVGDWTYFVTDESASGALSAPSSGINVVLS